jgi:hypothetical protein
MRAQRLFSFDILPPESVSPFETAPESSYPKGIPKDETMAPKAPAPKKVKKRIISPRPRYLSNQDIKTIVGIIQYWPKEPMTWELIRQAIAYLPGGSGKGKNAPAVWTRQALCKHDLIQNAYDERKRELATKQGSGGKRPRPKKSPETVVLREMVEARDIEIKELESTIAKLKHKIMTMLVNQNLGATTEEKLLTPLSTKIDRRPTDKPKDKK